MNIIMYYIIKCRKFYDIFIYIYENRTIEEEERKDQRKDTKKKQNKLLQAAIVISTACLLSASDIGRPGKSAQRQQPVHKYSKRRKSTRLK